jgi:hypothetical protein
VKKNRGQSGFGDYKCRIQKTKDHVVCRITKCGKNVGPALWGFGVHDFMISNAQTPTHNNSRIVKSEWKCRTNTSGFRVRDFAISNAQTPTHNNSRIAKSEWKVGPALRGFEVRDFAISSAKHQHTITPELRKVNGIWDHHFGVSGFTNSRCKNIAQRQTSNHEITKRYGAQPITGFDVW